MAPSTTTKRRLASPPSPPLSPTIDSTTRRTTRSTAFSPIDIPTHRRASHPHAPDAKRSFAGSASAFGLIPTPFGPSARAALAATKSGNKWKPTGIATKLTTPADFGLDVPDASRAVHGRITRAAASRMAARPSPPSTTTIAARRVSAAITTPKHTRFDYSPPTYDEHGSYLPSGFGRRSASNSPIGSSSRSLGPTSRSPFRPKTKIDPTFATASKPASPTESGSGYDSGSCARFRSASGSGFISGSASMNGSPTSASTPPHPSRFNPPTYVPQYPNPPQPYHTPEEHEYIDSNWSEQEKEAWIRENKEWKWKKNWDHEQDRRTMIVEAGGDVGYGPGKGSWDEPGRKIIDLVFCLDATGSMGSYLRSATENIRNIVAQIAEYEHLEREDDLRIAVVAYRDIPPQSTSFITHECHFTSDIDELHNFIGQLQASGGGDGPECTASALKNVYERLQWRKHSAKCCILVTDAPPHGIGERGDGFPNGEPEEYGGDPLVTAKKFAARGIPIFVVACEPGLSTYDNGVEFYQALSSITSGMMLPLKTADLLARAVIGAVLEHVQMENIVKEIGSQVAAKFESEGSIDTIIAALHRDLQFQGAVTKQVRVDNVYNETASYKNNVEAWINANSLQEGLSKLIPWNRRDDRFTDGYRSSYGGGRSLPARPRSDSPASVVSARAAPPTPPKSTYMTRSKVKSPRFAVEEDDDEDNDDDGMSDSDSEVERKTRSKASPVKPVETFALFKASPGTFGKTTITSPSAKTVAEKPAFKGMRSVKSPIKGMDDDDDEDSEAEVDERNLPMAEDDAAEAGADTLGFGMAAISLEQAKRIAHQSVWRMRG